ncbi:4-alpha-glucanotransferase [Egicoccus halophilus]|uniref:4-alpha-glucanotransferase n=1 Tax=Egicoccus halophilus TaxID=1670830 RepID=A0A8J3EUV7_9ACTN|nr:4-alpha-glucanotransferase [Egicoccus halophilus]
MEHPGPQRRTDEERRRTGGRSVEPDGWGIVTAYEDAFGAWAEVPAETRDALVRAMGGDPAEDRPPQVDAVLVVRVGETVSVPGAVELRLEDGTQRTLEGSVPDDVPTGYHDLVVEGRDTPRRLIVSPGRCHLPDDLVGWGWSVQLYAARSAGSWGIGDFADLRHLASWSADLGASTMLINPLDAVTPVAPRETSPYYPTSRRFLDPIYLRLDEVPGASDLEGFDRLADDGRALTDDRPIDRDRVMAAKLEVLERLWREGDGCGDEDEFLRFAQQRGEALAVFATFCALAEHHGTGWRQWPAEHRHPANEAVGTFSREHADRVRFHCWLQWLCDEQLRSAGAPLALLGDLPIGADPDGADAWAWQDVLATGVSVGAPPDELGPQGQNWTLPAFVPWKLEAARYEPFIDIVRAALRHVGGLRIDHVLGLFRMFWIPPEGTAADGAYVKMPTDDLFDILALESQRAGAFVVGEDLGTVPEGVREELDDRDVLRYQVWWFEQDPLEDWSEKALASVSTHDLPTVAGVWSGDDARMQAALGHEPDEEWHATLRERIVEATGVPADASAAEAVVALHRHLASAPNQLVLAQLDDAVAAPHRPNVPGTDRTARPENWALPLPVRLEDLPEHPTVQAVNTAMSHGRSQAAGRTPRD